MDGYYHFICKETDISKILDTKTRITTLGKDKIPLLYLTKLPKISDISIESPNN